MAQGGIFLSFGKVSERRATEFQKFMNDLQNMHQNRTGNPFSPEQSSRHMKTFRYLIDNPIWTERDFPDQYAVYLAKLIKDERDDEDGRQLLGLDCLHSQGLMDLAEQVEQMALKKLGK